MKQVQTIPLLYLANPLAPKIVETDASDLGYGGILKQVQDNKEQDWSISSFSADESYYSSVILILLVPIPKL